MIYWDNAALAEQLRYVLQRCQNNNITLSKKKMEVGDEVHFAGRCARVQTRPPQDYGTQELQNPNIFN